MERKNTVQEDVVSLDVLTKRDGVYCKKEDMSGNGLKFAYITSDAMMLTIWNNSEKPSIERFCWNENEIENHEIIANFLSELAFRPLYEKGTPAEKNDVKLMWQICMDCSQIPKEFINYNNNLKSNSK